MANSPGSRPSRVLHVINDLALGGAQRVVLNQTALLDPACFAPEIASFEIDPRGTLVPSFRDAGLVVHRLRRPNEPSWAGWTRLQVLLRRMRPDIVHTHLAAAGVAGRVTARICGVPRVVTTLHNLSDWEEKRLSPLRWLDRRTLPLADAVVTVSDAVRRAFVRAVPDMTRRVVTVHNGVPLHEFRDARRERDSMRAALGWKAEDFVVGTIARLDPRKGLDTLIEALAIAKAHVRELGLLLVGDGSERERLRALARARGVEHRVLMVHHQTRARGYLGAMDLFVAPSRTEGLGMAIIEALAAGVPVVASRVGGIPEVIQDGVNGRLLPPGQPELWAETMANLARRPMELEAWAIAGLERSHSFSLEASALALQRVYEQILGVEQLEAPSAAAA